MFCCIGIYSVNNNPDDVLLTAFFGLVGYGLIKLGFEPAPMLLGFVLGKLMEEYMRRSILMSRGNWMTFIERPLSLALLIVALILIVLALMPSLNSKRDEVFTE